MKTTSIEEQRKLLVDELEQTNQKICKLRAVATRLQAQLAALKNGVEPPASKPAATNSKPAVTFDQATRRLEELRARRAKQ
jgi:hypothetical protein